MTTPATLCALMPRRPRGSLLLTLALIVALAYSYSHSAHAAVPKGVSNTQCYAQAAYFEARGQGHIAMRLVQSVTYNRVLDKRWPSTACRVVWQNKQYSWTLDRVTVRTHKSPVAIADRAALDTARSLATRLRNGDWEPSISANHFLSPAALSGGFPLWARCTEALWATGGCVVHLPANQESNAGSFNNAVDGGTWVRAPDFTYNGIWFYTL